VSLPHLSLLLDLVFIGLHRDRLLECALMKTILFGRLVQDSDIEHLFYQGMDFAAGYISSLSEP